VAKVGTSKAGGTISQQAAVHLWLAADAHGNKQKKYVSIGTTINALFYHISD
jgi:formylmethanofuran dehydrogenase subunit C